ncbi:MAG: RsmD family RNA methyltransferase [Alphaproteobacteria bacterium]|nr:RsmD family RNA methyltransferase [Alphaproteobacteria bacterium]
MRVISGLYRGKKLLSADETITRPTSDRAKEGLFNILNNYLLKHNKSWQEICFCDVFAGSGAIGIEAVSRGTKNIFLFENNRLALKFIRENSKGMPVQIIETDACFPPVAKKKMDIIFFDAPYGKGLWQKSLDAFYKQGWIDSHTLIIVEIDKKIKEEIPPSFTCVREQEYGRNLFLFLQMDN